MKPMGFAMLLLLLLFPQLASRCFVASCSEETINVNKTGLLEVDSIMQRTGVRKLGARGGGRGRAGGGGRSGSRGGGGGKRRFFPATSHHHHKQRGSASPNANVGLTLPLFSAALGITLCERNDSLEGL